MPVKLDGFLLVFYFPLGLRTPAISADLDYTNESISTDVRTDISEKFVHAVVYAVSFTQRGGRDRGLLTMGSNPETAAVQS